MSNRPFRPSPGELLRASRDEQRKRAIAAILEHYAKQRASESPAADAERLTEEELELLLRVLGIDRSQRNHWIRRNRYMANRFGSAHRTFERLRDRGLVTLRDENSFVVCEATSVGIGAVRTALQQGKAA